MEERIDVFREVLIALRRILRATDMQAKRLARETGLTTPQLIALHVIDAAGSLSAGELAREITLSHATVTAILTRLDALGYVSRQRHDEDKRRVVVSLTAAGRDVLERAPPPLQDQLARRFAGLESWEKLAILAAVQRLAQLLDAADLDAAPLLEVGSLGSAPPDAATTAARNRSGDGR